MFDRLFVLVLQTADTRLKKRKEDHVGIFFNLSHSLYLIFVYIFAREE